MNEIHISNILETATLIDDLSVQLEDHLRRMGSIDAECPLDLANTLAFDFPTDAHDQWN